MILAAVDGTLAIDFGQKSRLGGFLNDAGDMLSDVALFVPLAFVASFQPCWVALVIALTALCEVVGIVAGTMRGDRAASTARSARPTAVWHLARLASGSRATDRRPLAACRCLALRFSS